MKKIIAISGLEPACYPVKRISDSRPLITRIFILSSLLKLDTPMTLFDVTVKLQQFVERLYLTAAISRRKKSIELGVFLIKQNVSLPLRNFNSTFIVKCGIVYG